MTRWENHKRSKKHLAAVQALKRYLAEEDDALLEHMESHEDAERMQEELGYGEGGREEGLAECKDETFEENAVEIEEASRSDDETTQMESRMNKKKDKKKKKKGIKAQQQESGKFDTHSGSAGEEDIGTGEVPKEENEEEDFTSDAAVASDSEDLHRSGARQRRRNASSRKKPENKMEFFTEEEPALATELITSTHNSDGDAAASDEEA